jgi:ATP-dependent exoDNAse (exonuclease V) beta subunit
MSFAVYKASAGSGKTFSLVREYLKIILREPRDFRHILAITFTNKAANEMKERVLKTLTGLSTGAARGQDKMLPLLMKDTGLPPEMIALKASEAMELILHHYSDFAIGTIDSFSHRIIRTFAHDFGLQVNFNVEIDTDALLETTIDLLLDRVGDDKELTGLLVDFLESKIDEEHDWRVDRELAKFSRNILDESGQFHLIKLRNITLDDFRKISSSVHARARKIKDSFTGIGEEALELIRNSDVPYDAFFQGKSGLPSFFINLSRGEPKAAGPRAKTTVEEDNWTSKKCTSSQAEAIASIRDRLLDLYENAAAIVERDGKLYNLLDLLRKTIYPLALLNEISRILDEFKRQNNLVHISEFNNRISRIIMGEPVPYIYERLGEKYRHILIDEFQDTSAMQWMNFVPLIENALASGYFNLVVGDGKQAIYRFRNGDVEQFSSLPRIPGSDTDPVLKQREDALVRNFDSVPLNVNYRSGKEIVEFNNRFFRILTDALFPDGNEVYGGLEQETGPDNGGGFISIEVTGAGEDATGYQEAMLARIMDIIAGALSDGYAKNDMVILCRSNDNASTVARFLLLNGIDVISAESLLVVNSPHVAFIIAFIRFLHGMPDPLVHAELATYLMEQDFSKAGLHSLMQKISHESSPGAGITEIFRECGLDIRTGELAGLPVYDLAEKLIRIFGMNEPPDPYLQFFLDAVLRFNSKVSTGSRDFLEWWELNKQKISIVVPEGLDAVRVMTIHKAKGLQFPIVVYAFATDFKKNTKDWLWADFRNGEVPGLPSAILKSEKKLSETTYADLFETENRKSLLDLVNMLYVAMTRPEERLYILTKELALKGELQSLPKFFAFVLQQMDVYEDGKTEYTFGIPSKRSLKPGKESAQPLRLEKMISGEWRKKIHVKFHAPEMWNMDQPVQSSQWGSRIHTILAGIITRDDLAESLEKAVFSGLIRTQEREQAEHVIRPLFSHPLLSRLFSHEVKVMTEAEILVPSGLFYRPDRVVFDGEVVIVVDYKTGRQNERHRTQLNQYAALLEEMGYNKVQRVLVYLEPKLNVVRF